MTENTFNLECVIENGVSVDPCEVRCKLRSVLWEYMEDAGNHGVTPDSFEDLEMRYGLIGKDAEIIRTTVLELYQIRGDKKGVQEVLDREERIRDGQAEEIRREYFDRRIFKSGNVAINNGNIPGDIHN